jgi:predicted transcriptional regulator with HTH domain
MFLKLTLEYVEAINSGGIPQILTSLDRVIQQEARKVLEDLKNLYQSRVALTHISLDARSRPAEGQGALRGRGTVVSIPHDCLVYQRMS